MLDIAPVPTSNLANALIVIVIEADDVAAPSRRHGVRTAALRPVDLAFDLAIALEVADIRSEPSARQLDTADDTSPLAAAKDTIPGVRRIDVDAGIDAGDDDAAAVQV